MDKYRGARQFHALLLALVASVALLGSGCDDFPSVAIQNDLDRPVGITWSHEIREMLVPVNGQTTILIGEGEPLNFTLFYDGEGYEIEVPWDRYSLTADQIGDSDYKVFLSSVIPSR